MSFSHPSHKRLLPGQQVSTSGEVLAYAASAHPDKTGIICGERSWSFKELNAAANQFANGVLERFAGSPGPVGIMARNSAEYVIAHFGTARTGRATANFPTRCTRADLIRTINLTRPVLLILDAESRAMVEEARDQLEAPPVQLGLEEFAAFLDEQPATPPDLEVDPDGPGSIIFTGGTTGAPKAVLSSHRARAISSMAAVEDFRIDASETAGYSVPLTHTAGLFSWFQPAILAGCTGVIIAKWDTISFMELAERHGISVIFAVPAQLAGLLNRPEFDPGRLKSLKRIVFGGAPIARHMIEKAEALMPWMECHRAYGSSETGHLAVQIKTDRHAAYDGYNQPGGRLEIEIFKSPGTLAAIGEVGEVATRGEHLMSGYMQNPEAQAAFFKSDETQGDWGWMGDLALRHEGYFTLVGRSKHMILSGGMNIYPAELEEILGAHMDVADCAVVGLDDETWGERPVAAIVAAEGAAPDVEALLVHVAAGVSDYKKLRDIFVVAEIPRTAGGKVQVDAVRDICAGLAGGG